MYTHRMDLGWCDVCLNVKDAAVSRSFYEGLGFRRVEGDDDEGWAVVTNGDVRLGLYDSRHTDADALTLNFRGADVFAVAEELTAKGYAFSSGPTRNASGGCSAVLLDPDGHRLFFDTAPGETKKE
ncbi:MAG: VOC family protein [Armatimonadetes bacterium]|nr:VOC family protein [Armatimonadota bacterium]